MTTQALFLDFENVGNTFDLVKLVDFFSSRGELTIRRAFGARGQLKRWEKKLLEASLDRMAYTRHTTGKNRADIELVVDVMDTAYLHPQIDTFIIVSGDSDFIPLVLKLHDLRRRVIVVGREASSSPVLKSVSDEFISIREFYSGHHVPNEVPSSCLDCIIWAHRLNQECDRRLEMLGIGYIGRGAETIGRLSEALLDLFPHFRPQAFGFPKNSGLRKLIQTLELDGICELEKGTAPGELLIHFRRDAISKVIKQPAAYEKILARRVKRGEKAFRKQWGETYGSDPPEMVRRLQSVTSDS